MKIYHDNRLSLCQTAAFKTKFRGTVHLCFVVATFLLVTGHVLPGLLNLELQLAMSPFNFLIRSQLLLSEFNRPARSCASLNTIMLLNEDNYKLPCA